MRVLVFLAFLIIAAPTTSADPGATASNVEKQMREWACSSTQLDAVTKRLAELRDADQQSRAKRLVNPTDDTHRRIEVAEIYAKGCLQRAEDFHHAALIFQHGNSPEHYYQAWFFASRAVAMGDESARWLIPRAIDRYLLNTGYKQLFGTNAVTPHLWDSESKDKYRCLWPVEEGLSDAVREEFGIKPLSVLRENRADSDNSALNPETNECPISPESPPTGIFPGVW